MQNITENNKLIAEFMAGEKNKQVYIKHLNAWYDNCMGYKYNTDWNWLMEVVDKIEEMDFVFNIQYTLVETHDLRDVEFKHTFKAQDKKTRIESVYNACVTFIEWYNEQK